MKIGLYSPFAAAIVGGGERYLLTLAECLLLQHEVDLVLPQVPVNLREKFINNFRLKLDRLNLVAGPFGKGNSSWQRWQFTKQYDVFFYMTDGSFFVSGAKRNIAHFMVPFNRPAGLWQRLKLKVWPIKTTHSVFCQEALERIWKIKIDFVLPGAVDSRQFLPQNKSNLILSVGRFFSLKAGKHCKRQDFLVKTFKKLCDQGLKGWRLVLTGPVDPGQDNRDYLDSVKKLAQGYPVEFHIAAGWEQLLKDYGRAKIYWHATGYGQNEHSNPQVMEHFGISTLEAMSAAVVPVVIGKGGQKEIVSHTVSGFLWDKQSQLMKYTRLLIADETLRQKLARQARRRAKDFSPEKFCQITQKIFNL